MVPSGCGVTLNFPANLSDTAIRVEFFGDEIDRITEIDVLTGEIKCSPGTFCNFSPASHYVVPMEKIPRRPVEYRSRNGRARKVFQRRGQAAGSTAYRRRTNFDIEMLKETGFCSGIENYSRHLAGLPAGATPIH